MEQPHDDAPTIFYRIPAEHIEIGMSTEDGQDVVAVSIGDGRVLVTVYMPSDDPVVDEGNRCEPETRVLDFGELVGMATFPNSGVDGSSHDFAVEPV